MSCFICALHQLKGFILSKDNRNNQASHGRKRQWGAEKRTEPLSILHEEPSTFKIAASRIAIVLTVVFWLMYLSSIIRQFIDGPKSYDFTMQAFGYLIVMTVLTFSVLMYLIARQGAFQRLARHVRVSRAILDNYFAKKAPNITVLVPSYAEEPAVIRKSLLSAALQEYPSIRVVLLLDDEPNPTTSTAIEKIDKTRSIAQSIEKLLSKPYLRFSRARARFEKESHKKYVNNAKIQTLAGHYIWAAGWLRSEAKREENVDHVDVFFKDQVLGKLAFDLETVASALNASIKEGAHLPYRRIHELYNRLVWIFGANVEVFERKKYASLSHESNKAMNLNSYIGLMGGSYRLEETPKGTILIPVTKKAKRNLTVADSDYILTLDADSILLREYCLRLIYFLEQPANSRVAVAQTPYSSFRGAFSRIEKLAGATTDIQHILHQGMTQYGATFWVGANAVIRKRALEEIVEKEHVGGFEIKRFIQDRTVIEDTESSIDLALRGWKLFNYPERLSYSATPPDFGSLIVQRRRWANGGLLILPKLFAVMRERKMRHENIPLTEVLLRVNYMASIAWASFGLLFLLAFPYDGRLLSPLVLLAALPYFISMAVDLKYCGYNYSDIFKIYGFNLILLPVNLAGVLKSLQQGLTGKKIPFARTPKIKNRTVAPLSYVLAPLFIISFSIFTMWRNIEGEHWGNAAFAGFNTVAITWATIAYIGIGNMFADIRFGLTDWLYVETKPKEKKAIYGKPALDWKAVLYHGEIDKASK